MVRVSNSLVGALNVVTFLLAVPILGGGIWLSLGATTDCARFVDRPLIVLGAALMLVSLAGLVGACCRSSFLMWVYLLVMFLLIVVVLCFTIFAFLVTNKGAGEIVSGQGFMEYRLGDYSNWLQRRVVDEKNWAKIRSCLKDARVCRRLQRQSKGADQFLNENLSPIESGCCKPPTACNFTHQSATDWAKPAGFTTSSISDCNTWDQHNLCFDCQSCKGGVLAKLKKEWKKVTVVNIIFLVVLIVVYSTGCCAFKNNRRDNARHKGYH